MYSCIIYNHTLFLHISGLIKSQMSSVVVPECFLTLTLYLSSDRLSLIPFNIESLIIMTSFLLSILEFLKDDCFDDILANDSDSNDDAF